MRIGVNAGFPTAGVKSDPIIPPFSQLLCIRLSGMATLILVNSCVFLFLLQCCCCPVGPPDLGHHHLSPNQP